MSNGLDVERLRHTLENRFLLKLINQQEIVDGGVFSTIRPAYLEQGNGFAILLARTHRQFEASFKADNFAGALLRTMSEAGDSERITFLNTRQAAETAGIQIYIGINGNANEDCFSIKERWSSVEIDVSKRFSSNRTPEDLMATALQVTSACLSLVLPLVASDDECSSLTECSERSLPEGAKLRVEVNRYERSPANRAACIEHYGLKCRSCGFDFLAVYGALGEGYIEVHHCTPVSQMGANYLVDPVHDLIPLCGNCHSMVHRSDPPMPVDDLRVLIANRRGK